MWKHQLKLTLNECFECFAPVSSVLACFFRYFLISLICRVLNFIFSTSCEKCLVVVDRCFSKMLYCICNLLLSPFQIQSKVLLKVYFMLFILYLLQRKAEEFEVNKRRITHTTKAFKWVKIYCCFFFPLLIYYCVVIAIVVALLQYWFGPKHQLVNSSTILRITLAYTPVLFIYLFILKLFQCFFCLCLPLLSTSLKIFFSLSVSLSIASHNIHMWYEHTKWWFICVQYTLSLPAPNQTEISEFIKKNPQQNRYTICVCVRVWSENSKLDFTFHSLSFSLSLFHSFSLTTKRKIKKRIFVTQKANK